MLSPATFVFIGGPMDGITKSLHWATTSTLYKSGSVVHRYRLRGTRNDPVLSQDGHRIMDHHKIARMIEPSDTCEP